jgi:hypothetical protein
VRVFALFAGSVGIGGLGFASYEIARSSPKPDQIAERRYPPQVVRQARELQAEYAKSGRPESLQYCIEDVELQAMHESDAPRVIGKKTRASLMV